MKRFILHWGGWILFAVTIVVHIHRASAHKYSEWSEIKMRTEWPYKHYQTRICVDCKQAQMRYP